MDTPAFLNDTLWAGKIFNGDWIAADGGTHPITEPATGQQLGSTGTVSYTHLTLPTTPYV